MKIKIRKMIKSKIKIKIMTKTANASGHQSYS
jgi:hypothetical protein